MFKSRKKKANTAAVVAPVVAAGDINGEAEEEEVVIVKKDRSNSRKGAGSSAVAAREAAFSNASAGSKTLSFTNDSTHDKSKRTGGIKANSAAPIIASDRVSVSLYSQKDLDKLREGTRSLRPTIDASSTTPVSGSVDMTHATVQTTNIPSAATIQAVKAQRSRERQLLDSAAQDFIPLKSRMEHSKSAGVAPMDEDEDDDEDDGGAHTRLVREGDDDMSEDDHGIADTQRTYSFAEPSAPSNADRAEQIRQALQRGEDIGVSAEYAEEMNDLDEWELEAMRKGGVTDAVMREARAQHDAGKLVDAVRQRFRSHANGSGNGAFDAYEQRHMEREDPMTNTFSFEAVTAALEQATNVLDERHRMHERDVHRLEALAVEAEHDVKRLATEEVELGERLEKLAGVREYVLAVLGCVDAKMATIEALDHRVHALSVRERQSAQRARDLFYAIELQWCERALGVVQTSLQDEEQRLHTLAGKERDAIGEQRRRLMASVQEAEDTLFSIPQGGDRLALDFCDAVLEREQRSEAAVEALAVFSDADNQFCTVKGICARFGAWKAEHPLQYAQAFCAMALPKALAPIISAQLLSIQWSPLHGSASMEACEWFGELFVYGTANKRKEALSGLNGTDLRRVRESDAADADLLPAVIRRCVLPLIDRAVEHEWDPHSRSQTRRLAGVLASVGDFFDGGFVHTQLQPLVAKIAVQCAHAVEQVSLPVHVLTAASKSADPVAKTRTLACALMQFWHGVELFANTTLLREIVGRATLEPIAVGELFNGRLMPFVRNMPCAPHQMLSLCEGLLCVYPRDWCATEKGALVPALSGVDQLLRMLAFSLVQSTDAQLRAKIEAMFTMCGDLDMASKFR